MSIQQGIGFILFDVIHFERITILAINNPFKIRRIEWLNDILLRRQHRLFDNIQ
ncbi:Uncharacterised protein [Vibrio cholerae]|uniref:Uncharacterized protein n=1 Tax=Vibrio cholerae TaxID=666 RepID=A0A655UV16_VIBCL|nr:Uncharacterised protein [Vibrio cholerae]CSA11353.1 Uncharacterised protein [Vibrio cholerae]CSA19619.1 Uncharacterised protein [Vibrio cholerae]CSA21719.1 Uncharacterised protein [Vibrio cholerae]CSA28217.1 Uncharacterised protein [Vibrio cholerae]